MALGVQGQSKRYRRKYKYAIEIAGIQVAWWKTCTPIKATFDIAEDHEAGNANVANEEPVKVKWADVTMAVGLTDNTELYDWFQQTYDAVQNIGEPDQEYKRNVSILNLGRDGKILERNNLTAAFIKEFEWGGWDAGSSETQMETMTLRYKLAERKAA